jgi:hypothetical protein
MRLRVYQGDRESGKIVGKVQDAGASSAFYPWGASMGTVWQGKDVYFRWRKRLWWTTRVRWSMNCYASDGSR